MEGTFLRLPGLLACTIVALSACGGGGGGNGAPLGSSTPPPVERYALVAAYNGDTLASYAVHADTGLMRLVAKAPLNQATSVALRPGHDEVVALSATGHVDHYQLDTDGRLQAIVQVFPGGGQLTDMVVHPSHGWVYVSNAEGIYRMMFDPENDGELTNMAPDPFVEPDYADPSFTALLLSRDGNHLYASDLANDRIARFDVEQEGGLVYVDYVDAGDGPYRLARHPGRHYLYAANRFDGTLSQYRVLPDGALETLAAPLLAGQNAQLEDLVIDRRGRFLYASDLANDKVWQFRIAAGGTLQPLATPAFEVETAVMPRSLIASPASDRIYLADGGAGAMLAFSFDNSGELEAMTPDRVAMDARPSDMVFTTGKALTAHTRAAYVINGNEDSISQFTFDDDGTLTPLGDADPATGDYPVAIAGHPGNGYFYVANANDDTVSQFRRVTSPLMAYDVDELAPLRPPVSVDIGPAALAVHPSGNFLYVVSRQNQTVSAYGLEINGEIVDNNGIGEYMPDDPTILDEEQVGLSNPAALTIDPTGRFLWVVNDGPVGFVVLFRINTNNGTLTRIDEASLPAGQNPKAVAVNASGEVLYVAASGDSQVRGYAVQGDGSLIPDGTGNTGQGTVSLLTAPLSNRLYLVNQVDSSVGWFGGEDVGGVASTGTAPSGIAMDLGERHALVTNLASANLTRFSVAANGALTAEETVATGAGPLGVAISNRTE